ncbi:MAG: hypothetical protein AMXMBFR7_27380 [Planctomycetota bacterium]
MFCTHPGRMLAELPGAAWRALSGTKRVVLLKHRAALGDLLMLTPLVRALRKHLPDFRIAVATQQPELFLNNPYIDENRTWHVLRTAATVRVGYELQESDQEHYVEMLWARLWSELAERGAVPAARPPLDGRHPELFLSDAERARGRELLGKRAGRPAVVLISGGKTRPTHNREWGYANYAALAEALAPHCDLLQISGDEELVFGPARTPVRNLRVGLREAASILAACDAFLTQEGGLMHVARAVEAPCVTIFGGTLWPEHSGYDRMRNLSVRPDCSPCRHTRQNCAHLVCMSPLTPRRVLGEISVLLIARGYAIPPEALERAPDTWTPPPFVDRAALEAERVRRPSQSWTVRAE